MRFGDHVMTISGHSLADNRDEYRKQRYGGTWYPRLTQSLEEKIKKLFPEDDVDFPAPKPPKPPRVYKKTKILVKPRIKEIPTFEEYLGLGPVPSREEIVTREEFARKVREAAKAGKITQAEAEAVACKYLKPTKELRKAWKGEKPGEWTGTDTCIALAIKEGKNGISHLVRKALAPDEKDTLELTLRVLGIRAAGYNYSAKEIKEAAITAAHHDINTLGFKRQDMIENPDGSFTKISSSVANKLLAKIKKLDPSERAQTPAPKRFWLKDGNPLFVANKEVEVKIDEMGEDIIEEIADNELTYNAVTQDIQARVARGAGKGIPVKIKPTRMPKMPEWAAKAKMATFEELHQQTITADWGIMAHGEGLRAIQRAGYSPKNCSEPCQEIYNKAYDAKIAQMRYLSELDDEAFGRAMQSDYKTALAIAKRAGRKEIEKIRRAKGGPKFTHERMQRQEQEKFEKYILRKVKDVKQTLKEKEAEGLIVPIGPVEAEAFHAERMQAKKGFVRSAWDIALRRYINVGIMPRAKKESTTASVNLETKAAKHIRDYTSHIAKLATKAKTEGKSKTLFFTQIPSFSAWLATRDPRFAAMDIDIDRGMTRRAKETVSTIWPVQEYASRARMEEVEGTGSLRQLINLYKSVVDRMAKEQKAIPHVTFKDWLAEEAPGVRVTPEVSAEVTASAATFAKRRFPGEAPSTALVKLSGPEVSSTKGLAYSLFAGFGLLAAMVLIGKIKR